MTTELSVYPTEVTRVSFAFIGHKNDEPHKEN